MVANNSSKPSRQPAKSEARVTRVKAVDDRVSTPKAVSDKKSKAKTSTKKTRKVPKALLAFVALGRYFAGAWKELREVRWPNRGATWGLTIAVILFSVALTALILALDAVFKLLFEMIIK